MELEPPKFSNQFDIPDSTPNKSLKINLNEEIAKLSFISYADKHNKKPLYDLIITSITQNNAINVKFLQKLNIS